jgi:hypothetical protein
MQTQTALKETEADQLIDAWKLARKHFPKEPAQSLLDGLELCRDNGGLYKTQLVCFAFFRYHPGGMVEDRRMFDVVREWDILTLKQLDLSAGPVVHVMFFSADNGCFDIFRRLINALNPKGVSAHRIKSNGLYHFSLRKHVRYCE